MKRNVIISVVFMISSLVVMNAQTSDKKLEYNLSLGFNIGGTTPIGLPAEIRGINSYQPTLNLTVGASVIKMFSPKWGIDAGLRFENKGMKTGVDVKNWQMTVNIQSGDDTGTKTGYFTGSIKNKTSISYLTLPIKAVYRLNDKWDLKGGFYFSYAMERSFTGNVVKGQIRETPLHPVIGITKADYDYSDDLRKFDTGIELGANWKVYKSLAVHANLTWGFLTALDPNKRRVDMDNYNVYFNIGVNYTL